LKLTAWWQDAYISTDTPSDGQEIKTRGFVFILKMSLPNQL